MTILRKRLPLLCVLLLLALAAGACGSNYYTIGAGPQGIQLPTKSSGAKTSATPTKRAAQLAIQPTPTTDKTIYCRLSDLTPAATWAASGDALTGSLTLANYWNVPCTLRGQPTLGLTDDSGVEFFVDVTEPTDPVNPPNWQFNPNTVGEIRFTWQNWCSPENGAMRVTVSMSGQGQPVLYVPVRDASGAPLNTTPPCKNDKARSTLTAEGLMIIK